jgi:hypothetical protein
MADDGAHLQGIVLAAARSIAVRRALAAALSALIVVACGGGAGPGDSGASPLASGAPSATIPAGPGASSSTGDGGVPTASVASPAASGAPSATFPASPGASPSVADDDPGDDGDAGASPGPVQADSAIVIIDGTVFTFDLGTGYAYCRLDGGWLEGYGYGPDADSSRIAQSNGTTLGFSIPPNDWVRPAYDGGLWAIDDPFLQVERWGTSISWDAGRGPFPSTSVTYDQSHVFAWDRGTVGDPGATGETANGRAYFIERSAAVEAELAGRAASSVIGTFQIDCRF